MEVNEHRSAGDNAASGDGSAVALAIVGPTAAGKSVLAVKLAEALDGEVVSIDSMQVYRHFTIGTGKLSLEERRNVVHHLIDIVEPEEPFSAATYVEYADRAIKDIAARGRLPIVVGGTGLYMRSLLHGLVEAPPADSAIRAEHRQLRDSVGTQALYDRLLVLDPEAASQIHPNDFVRISRALEVHQQTGVPISELRRRHQFAERRYRAVVVGLRVERETLRDRIHRRIDAMVERGWLAEVEHLRACGYASTQPMRGLGYRQFNAFLSGQLAFDRALSHTKRETWRFAKHQGYWFASEPDVLWVDDPEALDVAQLTVRLARASRKREGVER